MVLLSLYLVGWMIAFVLISILVYENHKEEDEFSGAVVAYAFSLGSFITVVLLLLTIKQNGLNSILFRRRTSFQ